MSEQALVKIELGCGRNKTEGYIGVDRFPLPGVDVVADMEKDLPFPDDYADVIYACHALEHVQNFEHLMEEVYRICKDGALIFVLAPYSRTTLNSANFYHKTIFNENTFRFFTSNPIAPLDWQEYKCEHALEWPLKGSDNSDCNIELTALHIEFFYYREYRALSPDERCNVRHGLNDVCDQIFYILAVNKKTEMLSKEEQAACLERAAQFEPPAIRDLRQRYAREESGPSLIADIQNWTDQRVAIASEILSAQTDQKVAAASEPILNTLQKSRMETQGELEATRKALREAREERLQIKGETEQLCKELGQLREELKQLRTKIERLQMQAEGQKQGTQALFTEIGQQYAVLEGRQQGLAAHMLELARAGKSAHREKRVRLFRPAGAEFYEALHNTFPNFIDGMILHDFAWRSTVPLTVSGFIPADTYYEYPIWGYGRILSFFLIGLPGSRVFIEIVADDTITAQQTLSVDGDGVYQIEIPPVRGKAAIRFRLVDNSSMVRVIEVSRRYALLFSKRDLACFLSD